LPLQIYVFRISYIFKKALGAFELTTDFPKLPGLGKPEVRTQGGSLSDQANASLCIRWPPKGSGGLREQLSHDAFSALPSQWSTAQEVRGWTKRKLSQP
jgi:hypothetical protein